MVATALAWHGDADFKSNTVAQMIAHREEDEIIQRQYQQITPGVGSGRKGCLIGCLAPAQPGGRNPLGGWHQKVEAKYGIPKQVGWLLDQIFESLPDGQHAAFAVDSIEAIPVGVDLSQVDSHMILDLLTDPHRGVWQHTAEGSAQRAAVDEVAELYRRRLAGDEPTLGEWRATAESAFAAGEYAQGVAYDAVDAAYEAARYGAREDTYDTAFDATETANSAARCAGDAAAKDVAWQWMAGRLLHHLRAAPLG